MLGSNIVPKLHRWYKSRYGTPHEQQWHGEDRDFYRLSFRVKHEPKDVPRTVSRLEEEFVIHEGGFHEGGLIAVVSDFELVRPNAIPSDVYTEEEMKLIMGSPADLNSEDPTLRLLGELRADQVLQYASMPFNYELRANIMVSVDKIEEDIIFEKLRLAHYNPYYRNEEVFIDYSFGPEGREAQQLLKRIKERDSFLSSMEDDEIIEIIVEVFEPIKEQIVQIAYRHLAPNPNIPTAREDSPKRLVRDIGLENIP